MSTEKIDEFKRLYSEYVDLNVKLHNYHLAFSIHKGVGTAGELKKVLKLIRKILLQMDKITLSVRREHLDNWRADVSARKIIRPDGSILRKRKTPNKRKK